MEMTKLELSRVIATALFNANSLISADNWKVKELTKRKKSELIELHKKAMKVITANSELQKVMQETLIRWGESKKKLASSGSEENIKKLISKYYFGSTITLHKVDKNKYSIANKKGLINGVRVINKKGRFIFEEFEPIKSS